MPDSIPGLPDPVGSPSFPVHDQGYDGSRTAATRRRRRQLALAGGGATTLSALLVGALLLPGPGGPQVLGPAQPPAPTAEPSGTATSRPTPQPGSPTPFASGVPGPLATVLGALSRPSRSPGPTGSPRPATTPSPDSRPAPANPGEPISGPEPTFTAYDVGQDCDGSGYTAANGWCSAHSGARGARRGTTVELATSMCRLPGQPDGQLRAASGQYAEFVVTDQAGAGVWTWSRGKRFTEDARTFTVPAGRCLRLAVAWDLRDDRGREVSAGDYVLTSSPLLTVPGVFVREKKPIAFRVD